MRKYTAIVSDGKARYSDQRAFESWKVQHFKRIRVVPRRELFVPDVDEEFFYLDNKETPVPPGTGVGDGDMKPPRPKEARMNRKINFRIEAVTCLLARYANAARLLENHE